MTLNEIIIASLSQMDRGHDPQTLEKWRAKFTRFANDAILDLAVAFKPLRRENAKLSGSVLDTATLERPCIKVENILKDGFPLRHSPVDASGIISVRGVGEVTVVYQYMPRELKRPSETPELPEHLHPLIVLYVTARERMSGDVSTQKGANLYMQLYEAGKARILSGTQPAREINNKFLTPENSYESVVGVEL